MYKVAFPTAADDDERREMEWVSLELMNVTSFSRSIGRFDRRMIRVTPMVDETAMQFGLQVNGQYGVSTKINGLILQGQSTPSITPRSGVRSGRLGGRMFNSFIERTRS
jgi:hypothetical protein